MTWEKPTYEDYVKATPFARVRYKWGLVVMVLAWLTILALFVYTINYVEELSTNPLKYSAEKYGLQCFCNSEDLIYTFNETEIVVQESLTRFGG